MMNWDDESEHEDESDDEFDGEFEDELEHEFEDELEDKDIQRNNNNIQSFWQVSPHHE